MRFHSLLHVTRTSISVRVVPLLLASLVAVVVGGCGGSGEAEQSKRNSSNTNSSTSSNNNSVEEKSPRETERDLLKTQWRKMASKLTRGNSKLMDRIRQAERFKSRALTFTEKYKVRSFPPLKQVESIINSLKTELELEGRGEVARLKERVMVFLKKEELDYLSADKLVKDFRTKKLPNYQGVGLEEQVAEIDKTIDIFRNAESKYREIEGKLKGSLDRKEKIAVLLGFSPEFAQTRFANEIQKMIDKEYQDYIEEKTKKAERIAKIAPRKFKLDDYITWYAPEDIETDKFEDGKIILGPNPSDWEEKDSQGSYIAMGEEHWIDVWVKMEVKVEDAENIYIGARGHEDFRGRTSFTPLSLGKLNIDEEDDSWLELIIEIDADRMRITSTKGGGASVKVGYPGGGYLILQVRGDNAKIEVKKCEYKLLKADETKLELEEADNIDDEDSDDDDSDDDSEDDSEEDT